MADNRIERREANPTFISNFEVCENHSQTAPGNSLDQQARLTGHKNKEDSLHYFAECLKVLDPHRANRFSTGSKRDILRSSPTPLILHQSALF